MFYVKVWYHVTANPGTKDQFVKQEQAGSSGPFETRRAAEQCAIALAGKPTIITVVVVEE